MVRQYLMKGLRFGQFYSPEDSDVFARVARRAAAQLPAGPILDLGCGSGIPTIHACGRRHWGVGIDTDANALELARANALAASRRNVVFIEADMMNARGRFALVMSNPPYIPCDMAAKGDPALEVGGDGTGVIKQILATYRSWADDFVIHFASITHPQEVFRVADECRLAVVSMELTVARFGAYTSAPNRLAYLLKCKSAGTAFFHEEPPIRAAAAPTYNQLLITVHYSGDGRRSRNRGAQVRAAKALRGVMERFQASGVRTLVECPAILKGRVGVSVYKPTVAARGTLC